MTRRYLHLHLHGDGPLSNHGNRLMEDNSDDTPSSLIRGLTDIGRWLTCMHPYCRDSLSTQMNSSHPLRFLIRNQKCGVSTPHTPPSP